MDLNSPQSSIMDPTAEPAEDWRFRELADAMPQIIWTAGADGVANYFNRRWYRYTGLPAGMLGEQAWLPFIHPDDVNEVKERWDATIKSGAPFQTELRLKSAHGGYRWHLARTVPIRDDQGRVVRWYGTSTDIEDQKQIVEALRRSESQLRTITDHAPAFIANCDRQRRFKFVNRSYAARFGLRPEDFIGRTIEETLGEEVGAVIRPYIDRVLEGQTIDFEVEVPYQMLGCRFMHGSYVPEINANGEVEGWFSVLTDVTEWKRAEEELRRTHKELEARVAERTAELTEATEFLQALLDSIEDGIVACNAIGELTLFNHASEKFHGRPCDSIPAEQWARRYDLYQPDGITPLKIEEIPLYRALRGEHVENVEMVIAPHNGERRTVLASGQSFRDGSGNLLGAVISMHDITARKKAEEELRQAHEELERRVAERTAELARANEALREADRLKDEFLAMLAHELRNPLAPIRNALHVMNQPQADRETAAQVRVMAERQVQHMARLLEDLLDMARIRQGNIELRRESLDVPPLVARVAEAIRPLAEQRKHQLSVNVAPGPLRVHGDPTRLEQVLTNLLHNACKYTDPGGQICLSATEDRGEIVLSVRDTGVGIAPEMLGRVFELFVQVERRLDRSQGGIGIGLTLVKKLVELHGGTIEARSNGVGCGSEFIVRLPAVGTPPSPNGATRKKAESWQSIGLPDYRVLVVDDNEDAADSMALLLRMAGQEVRVAYDGSRAVMAAMEFRPDLAFIDIGMPGMDGHEVAKQIRRQPGGNNIILIALTGWGQEEDRRRSREAGFDHHLVKPVEPAVLTRLLADPLPQS